MGDRGFNAGGYAYMATVKCPRCGFKYKCGRFRIDRGQTQCSNRERCEQRRKKTMKL